MKLAGADATLALHLERFEFRSATDAVMLRGHRCGQRLERRPPLAVPRPVLDVFEVLRVATWLDQVCTQQQPAPHGFTELRSASDESFVIRVFFELETQPRWGHKGFVDTEDRDCFIDRLDGISDGGLPRSAPPAAQAGGRPKHWLGDD